MGITDRFKKKPPKSEVGAGLGGDGYVTMEQLQATLQQFARDFMNQSVDLTNRAVDQRTQEWQQRKGGNFVADKEEAKDLRPLLFAPKDDRMMEMTIFTAKECALHPWLKTLALSLQAGRTHGTLLSRFLLYKEKCNRSLDGHLLDNTVTMASMDTQKDAFGDSHMSG